MNSRSHHMKMIRRNKLIYLSSGRELPGIDNVHRIRSSRIGRYIHSLQNTTADLVSKAYFWQCNMTGRIYSPLHNCFWQIFHNTANLSRNCYHDNWSHAYRSLSIRHDTHNTLSLLTLMTNWRLYIHSPQNTTADLVLKVYFWLYNNSEMIDLTLHTCFSMLFCNTGN